MTEKTRTVEERLHAAQMSLRNVAKDSKNEHMHYAYASCEDILAAARDAMHPQGLFTRQGNFDLLHNDRGQLMLCVEMHVVSVTGDSYVDTIHWPVEPGKGRPVDKALAAALSSSYAYWLRGLLTIPRGIQGEEAMDARDDAQYVPQDKPAGMPGPSTAQVEEYNVFTSEIAASKNLEELNSVAARIKTCDLVPEMVTQLRREYAAAMKGMQS